jgi:biopolymer transport protein ExbB
MSWQDLLEFLEKGGILMIPIVALSLLALGFFFERLLALRRGVVAPERTLRELLVLLGARRGEDALRYTEQHPSVLSRVAAAAIRLRGRGRDVLKEVMEEEGSLEVARLGKNVRLISTVATVEPLLGLLGTVTGMIKVFQKVSVQKHPDISTLAQGIWEALITTGAGLTGGIAAFLAFRYLQGRLERLGLDLEEAGLQVVNLMSATQEARDEAPVAPPAPSVEVEKDV